MMMFLRNGEFSHLNRINGNKIFGIVLVFWIILYHSTVQVSGLHKNLVFNTMYNGPDIPTSIGQAYVLDPLNSGLTGCDYFPQASNAKYDLEVHPIMYNGDALYGWFNIKITNNSGAPGLRWNLGQAQTTTDSIIPGEFLLSQFDKDNAPSCYTKYEPAGSFGNISKFNFVPGLYVADPNPTIPIGFGLPFSRELNVGPNALTLNWRMNFPFCGIFDSRRSLYFHVYLIGEVSTGTSNSQCAFTQFPKIRDITFQDYVSGAHDPDPPKNAKVDCSKSLADLQTDKKLPKWLSTVTGLNIKPYGNFFVNSNCTEKANLLRNYPAYQNQQFFGRCQFYDARTPIYSYPGEIGYDKPHYCESQNNDFWIKLPEQGEIITNNSNTGNTGAFNCKLCNNITKLIDETGISADSAIGKRVFSYRRGHGLFMIIGTIFFMTVSHFGAHFYKETFFNKRIINFHVWYTIHVNGSIMALLCFFVGMFAAIAAHLFFGYSKHIMGLIHVVLGWISIAVFVFVFITSGIRMRSPKPRIVTIFLHYLGGGFSYILNILCLATSCYIPASPSGRSDIHMSGFKFEFFFLVPLIVWILFDLGISIAMNFCMLSSDRKMRFKKKRKWALFAVCGVAIPMLRPYSKKDLEGTKLRKILLIVYFIVASLLTIALVVVEMTSPTKDRYFGPMTHALDAELFDDGANED